MVLHMRYLALIPLILLATCGSNRELRINSAHAHGAWTHTQIDASAWSEGVKAQCRKRNVVAGMTAAQVVASWGEPDSRADINGANVWIYDEIDDSWLDGAHIAQRSVRFDDDGAVAAVSSAG